MIFYYRIPILCADCKALPKTVKGLREQVETLVQTTSDILKTFETFSKSMEHKFDNLNDRLTGLSNQNKSSKEVCTSSLTDINKDITNLRSEMDKNPMPFYQKASAFWTRLKHSQIQPQMKPLVTISRKITKQIRKIKNKKAHQSMYMRNRILRRRL